MIGSYSESSYIWIVFISKHVTDHKFRENVYEDSLQIPRLKNRFLCNHLDEPLKASGRPGGPSRLSWRRSDNRSSFSKFYTKLDFRSRHCLWSFCKTSGRRDNTSKCCPAFQNILMFRLNTEMSYSEDRPDARPSRPDVYMLWKDLRYSGRQSQKTVWTRLNYRLDAR